MSPQLISSADLERKLQADIRAGKITRAMAQQVRLKRDEAEFNAMSAANPTSPLGAVISAGLNYGNAAGVGLPLTAAAGLTGAIQGALDPNVTVGEQIERNYEQGQRILTRSPVARTVGRTAAMFAPTPLNKLTGMGARALGISGALGARAARFADEGKMVGKYAAQILANTASGVGATLATSPAEQAQRVAFGERSVGDAIADLGTEVAVAGAFGLATGAVSAGFRVAKDAGLADLARKARQAIPGWRPSPDFYRADGGAAHDVLNAMAKSPLGRSRASAWLARNFYEPMEGAIGRFEGRLGIGRGLAGRAAAVNRAGAVAQALPDKIERGISAAGRPLGGPLGDVEIPPRALFRVGAIIERLNARASQFAEPRGGRLTNVLTRYRTALERAGKRGQPVTVRDLEEVRQSLAKIANFQRTPGDAISSQIIKDRDIREARILYHVVRKAMGAADPQVDRVMANIQALRRFADALRPAVGQIEQRDAATAAQAFFGASNALKRWDAATKLRPTAEIQALRGGYLADFFDEAMRDVARAGSRETRIALGPKMRRLWGSSGRFNAQLFDKVLPGFRDELDIIGEVSRNVMTGPIAAAEGSQTAGRLMMFQAIDETADMATAMATGGATANAFRKALGRVGTWAFARSLLDGGLGRRLTALASGEALTGAGVNPISKLGGGPVPLAALVNFLGGPGDVARAGTQAVSNVAQIPSLASTR